MAKIEGGYYRMTRDIEIYGYQFHKGQVIRIDEEDSSQDDVQVVWLNILYGKEGESFENNMRVALETDSISDNKWYEWIEQLPTEAKTKHNLQVVSTDCFSTDSAIDMVVSETREEIREYDKKYPDSADKRRNTIVAISLFLGMIAIIAWTTLTYNEDASVLASFVSVMVKVFSGMIVMFMCLVLAMSKMLKYDEEKEKALTDIIDRFHTRLSLLDPEVVANRTKYTTVPVNLETQLFGGFSLSELCDEEFHGLHLYKLKNKEE